MKSAGVLIIGSSGRMGCEIKTLLEADKNLTYAAGVSLEGISDKKTKSKLSDIDTASIKVVIDFSSPEFSLKTAEWCAQSKLPLVCGTTGFTATNFKVLTGFSKRIPLLYASNMSVGVAVLRQALGALKGLADYDFQIVETHHAKKKDKPSGTAITLQTELEKILKRKLPPTESIRGGGVFGVHTVYVMGAEETLEFTHSALSRAVFARGAVRAAKYLLKQKAGLYSIDDVLLDKSP